jgi:hypothetical protein
MNLYRVLYLTWLVRALITVKSGAVVEINNEFVQKYVDQSAGLLGPKGSVGEK